MTLKQFVACSYQRWHPECKGDFSSMSDNEITAFFRGYFRELNRQAGIDVNKRYDDAMEILSGQNNSTNSSVL